MVEKKLKRVDWSQLDRPAPFPSSFVNRIREDNEVMTHWAALMAEAKALRRLYDEGE